jgi:hypothetical protein
MSNEADETTNTPAPTTPPKRERKPAPPWPPEIAKAVVGIMRDLPEPEQNGYNAYSDYHYSTIDDVFKVTRPTCAQHGLFVYPVELSQDWVKVETDKGVVQVAVFEFEMMLVHESGVSWQHPDDTKRLRIPWSGPQTAGIAKSYVEKQFVKALFQISTNEKDGDEEVQSNELGEDGEQGRRPRRPRQQGQVVQPAANGEKKALPPLVNKKPAPGPSEAGNQEI